MPRRIDVSSYLTVWSSTLPDVGNPRQEQQPAIDGVEEVAPGIIRAQLPMSMPGLAHVNCYVIPDGDGCAVIDPGIPGADAYATMTGRLAEAGFDVGHVHTVLVTHSHPDHFGAAGRLAAEAEAELVTHSAFRMWFSEAANDPCTEVHDVDVEDLPTGAPWEGRTPWGGEGMSRPARLSFQAEDFVPPEPTRRLRDGDKLVLGGREWWAVHTPGHTLDHLCLLDAENGTFLSGDHVLPTITPHISGIASGRDPLAAFTASLDKVAALPGIRRVLPAHGLTFDDLSERVDAIKHHHDERLEKVRQIGLALGESTVEAYSHELFRPQVWGPMAESECYAHLEHLRLADLATRREVDGRAVYTIVG
jgi:glyoxylase-like metal-dependent hydrolase (beta-lactamase superfamily II)